MVNVRVLRVGEPDSFFEAVREIRREGGEVIGVILPEDKAEEPEPDPEGATRHPPRRLKRRGINSVRKGRPLKGRPACYF